MTGSCWLLPGRSSQRSSIRRLACGLEERNRSFTQINPDSPGGTSFTLLVKTWLCASAAEILSVKVFAACANFPVPIAQISPDASGLYRRASGLRVGADRARSTVLTVCRLEIGDTADWKSALLWLRLRRARSLRGSIAASRMSARTIARREKSPGPGFSRALSRAGRKIVVAKLKGFCFLYVNNAPFWCVG